MTSLRILTATALCWLAASVAFGQSADKLGRPLPRQAVKRVNGYLSKKIEPANPGSIRVLDERAFRAWVAASKGLNKKAKEATIKEFLGCFRNKGQAVLVANGRWNKISKREGRADFLILRKEAKKTKSIKKPKARFYTLIVPQSLVIETVPPPKLCTWTECVSPTETNPFCCQVNAEWRYGENMCKEKNQCETDQDCGCQKPDGALPSISDAFGF